MIDPEVLCNELMERKFMLLNGLAKHGLDQDKTEFERGKIAELNHFINVLRERAAEISR